MAWDFNRNEPNYRTELQWKHLQGNLAKKTVEQTIIVKVFISFNL